ncbi:MAG: type I-E CRISPR-associated protein Cse1/CasA, partial [Rhodobacteraceae bacterium]|nr:type I-E CRISPR-associated protein Cse1/CasA [Paracoccaceae bacterium]
GGASHRTSLRGGGPLTTLIVASHPRLSDTLWGRLWPNVETRGQIANRAVNSLDSAPIFPWLMPTRTSHSKSGGRSTTPADVHPLQVYWGMPRRIRLEFQSVDGAHCELTDAEDQVLVASYRTKNYGINYSEGFEHPLTPHYRQKTDSPKLPVHPNPGGISYRLWPGLLVETDDKLRDPAPVVRAWPDRSHHTSDTRFAVFGYDMDNMKARAWIEKEIPVWRFDDPAIREWCAHFVRRGTAGANTVARLLTGAVKGALHERPKEARGDYSFIAERFYRSTEGAFQAALDDALAMAKQNPDADDPTAEARKRWAPVMAGAALRLFDEYAPDYGIEERDMRRHVKARFLLVSALRGHGKAGKALFEDLNIPLLKTARESARPQEAA